MERSTIDIIRRGISVIAVEKQMTLPRISARAGMYEQTLGRFMRKKTDIRLGTLEQICEKGMGVSLLDVIEAGK